MESHLVLDELFKGGIMRIISFYFLIFSFQTLLINVCNNIIIVISKPPFAQNTSEISSEYFL